MKVVLAGPIEELELPDQPQAVAQGGAYLS